MRIDPPFLQSTAASLLLDDGTAVQGRGFGAARAVRGEVVFNTAMAGYVEALRARSRQRLEPVAWNDFASPIASDHGTRESRTAAAR